MGMEWEGRGGLQDMLHKGNAFSKNFTVFTFSASVISTPNLDIAL